jgi:hypothetical protein
VLLGLSGDVGWRQVDQHPVVTLEAEAHREAEVTTPIRKQPYSRKTCSFRKGRLVAM